jgi:hypothetical protein
MMNKKHKLKRFRIENVRDGRKNENVELTSSAEFVEYYIIILFSVLLLPLCVSNFTMPFSSLLYISPPTFHKPPPKCFMSIISFMYCDDDYYYYYIKLFLQSSVVGGRMRVVSMFMKADLNAIKYCLPVIYI